MNIEINPGKIFVNMLYLILFLLLANLIGIVAKFNFEHDHYRLLILIFDFDTEINIPTLYSSFSLILASILLLIIALYQKNSSSNHFYWFGMAFIFLFLSIDETVSIHERFAEPIRTLLNTSGLFYYAWVIPYGIALVLFVTTYFKFLMSLPKNIMILFVVSGTTYVTGAIGFEMFGGRYADLYGENNLTYAMLYTCEEFLEMLGIVIFVYALLTYMARELRMLTLTINEPKSLNSNCI